MAGCPGGPRDHHSLEVAAGAALPQHPQTIYRFFARSTTGPTPTPRPAPELQVERRCRVLEQADEKKEAEKELYRQALQKQEVAPWAP